MTKTPMRRLLAMGGGGFTREPENPLLNRYLFSLCPKPRPKVCFIGTAGGDSPHYIEHFYTCMKQHEVEPTHLSLFKNVPVSLPEFVAAQDIVYIGGGSLRNLLVLWRE